MFKILLILSLIGYLFYKVGGIFFRAGVASQHRRPQDTASNVKSGSVKEKKGGGIKGGEYVDYEEVK